MFDLKQTPDKRPTGIDIKRFYPILYNFVANHFNESLLNGYYRTQNALSVGALSIHSIPSTEAPKAFGVENEVQASLWIVHYHCLVTAPVEGDYTFVGSADNLIVVAMDGQLVLDAGMSRIAKDDAVRGPVGPGYYKGKTFHATAGQQIQMDILIGDDGGSTCFLLYLRKDGDARQALFQLNNGLDSKVKGPAWATWNGVASAQ
jgi:hypothetical protein